MLDSLGQHEELFKYQRSLRFAQNVGLIHLHSHPFFIAFFWRPDLSREAHAKIYSQGKLTLNQLTSELNRGHLFRGHKSKGAQLLQEILHRPVFHSLFTLMRVLKPSTWLWPPFLFFLIKKRLKNEKQGIPFWD